MLLTALPVLLVSMGVGSHLPSGDPHAWLLSSSIYMLKECLCEKWMKVEDAREESKIHDGGRSIR